MMNACAALHNICIALDSDYYFDPDIDDDDDDDDQNVPFDAAVMNNEVTLQQKGTRNRNSMVAYLHNNP